MSSLQELVRAVARAQLVWIREFSCMFQLPHQFRLLPDIILIDGFVRVVASSNIRLIN